jgi:hypothetical protein
MDFKILRIDPETKKIGLSARAVGKDEPIIDTKIYSSEAGGGMASLGELADFGLCKTVWCDVLSQPSFHILHVFFCKKSV